MPGMNIVAVTACVSGVAHTYMAAEQLEKLCQKRNYKIKTETQGALGIENGLTQEEITSADVAVIVCDISIEGMERFEHSRVVKMGIQQLLTDPDKLQAAIEKVRLLPAGTIIEPS